MIKTQLINAKLIYFSVQTTKRTENKPILQLWLHALTDTNSAFNH